MYFCNFKLHNNNMNNNKTIKSALQNFAYSLRGGCVISDNHFIKLEKELDKGLRIEDKKSSNYIVENLIRILLQKPLNQQEEWLNSILKALESEFPIPEEDLSLLNFSYLEKFSIEEFKKDIELDSLHSSFPLFLRLCSDDFILIKENDLTDIFINLLKELSPLGFDEVYLILEY